MNKLEQTIRDELTMILDYHESTNDDVIETVIDRIVSLTELMDMGKDLPFCNAWPWSNNNEQ